MLHRNLGLGALIAAPLLFSGIGACGGSGSSDDGTGGAATGGTGATSAGGSAGTSAGGAAGMGGGTGNNDPVEPGANPPPDPGSPTASGTTPLTMAISELFIGDTNPATGAVDANAWKSIGFNVDGIISTPNGANHCTPVTGANPANVKTDGDMGIDNSFGAGLIPIINSVAAGAGMTLNDSIRNGEFTLMLHMLNPGPESTQTGIDTELHGGGMLGMAPAFDGSDVWPSQFELLNNGDITDPKVTFPMAYMVDDQWVSGSKGTIRLTIAISGVELVLDIKNAVMAVDIDRSGSPATGTNGTIAGVLVTEELIDSLRRVAGSIDVSLCDGMTFDAIAQQIRVASDLMADGSNAAGATCDGISIGLGFNMQEVQLGAVAPELPPSPDPCATTN